MGTFLAQTGLYAGILALLSLPVVILGRRRSKHSTIRSFLIAAAVIALLCGAISLSSERAVDQCLEVGNTSCFDRGSVGMQVFFVSGYGIVSFIRSYYLWFD